jgi:hypothetical protein
MNLLSIATHRGAARGLRGALLIMAAAGCVTGIVWGHTPVHAAAPISSAATPTPSKAAGAAPASRTVSTASPGILPGRAAASGGGTISGTVTDSASGNPIVGAQVVTQTATATATTDSQGTYQIAAPPGGYSVIMSAAGWNGDFVGGVSVSAGATTTASIAMIAAPPQTAMDRFSRPDQPGEGTSSDGNVWTDDHASNPQAVVNITNRQEVVQTASGIVFDQWTGIPYQNQEVTVDLNMTSGGGRVLARVTGPSNWLLMVIQPNNQLALWTAVGSSWTRFAYINNLSLNNNSWYHTKIDVIGNQVFGKVWKFGTSEPSAWTISGQQSAVNGTGEAGIRGATSSTTFSSFRETAITRVVGAVTDASTNQPIAGATVSMGSGGSASTDQNGGYAIGGTSLIAGPYTVTVSAPGYAPGSQNASVSAGTDATVSFKLSSSTPPPSPGMITGTVTDQASGQPIAGALVQTQPASASAKTDINGNYQISAPAATYRVVVSASGWNTDFTAAVVVNSQATTTASLELLAVPPQTAMDRFSRPDQTNVGTSSDGHSWSDDRATYPNAQVSIANRQEVVRNSGNGQDYDQWSGISYKNQEVTADVNVLSSGAGTRVLARVVGNDTWVLFAINQSSSSLALWTTSGSAWTQFATVSNIPISTMAWYHAKVDVIGSTVSAKVWQFGTAEPGWQITGTQTTVNAAGVGGLRNAIADTVYQSFQEVAITRVVGTVTDASTGQPIVGAMVSVGVGQPATTDQNGHYTLGGVSFLAGSYNVTASAPGYTTGVQGVTATAGTDVTANFAL